MVTNSRLTSELSDCIEVTKTNCQYSLSLSSQSFKSSGGTGSVIVTAGSECGWTASSNADWLDISSPGNGKGQGLINYSVSANTAASSRSGTLNIGGQSLIVMQTGTGPVILQASARGKKLFIIGENFDEGARILINGASQKTKNDGDTPTERLIGKKAGRVVKSGDRLQVQNSNGAVSPEFVFP